MRRRALSRRWSCQLRSVTDPGVWVAAATAHIFCRLRSSRSSVSPRRVSLSPSSSFMQSTPLLQGTRRRPPGCSPPSRAPGTSGRHQVGHLRPSFPSLRADPAADAVTRTGRRRRRRRRQGRVGGAERDARFSRICILVSVIQLFGARRAVRLAARRQGCSNSDDGGGGRRTVRSAYVWSSLSTPRTRLRGVCACVSRGQMWVTARR